MNRQWLNARQPQGKIGLDTFQWTETAIPAPRDREELPMLSLDLANRAWKMGKIYRDALIGLLEGRNRGKIAVRV